MLSTTLPIESTESTLKNYMLHLKSQRGESLSEKEKYVLNNFHFNEEKFASLLSESKELQNAFYNKKITLNIHTHNLVGQMSGNFPVMTEEGTIQVVNRLSFRPNGKNLEVTTLGDHKPAVTVQLSVTDEQYKNIAEALRYKQNNPSKCKRSDECSILGINTLLKEIGIIGGLQNVFSESDLNKIKVDPIKFELRKYIDPKNTKSFQKAEEVRKTSQLKHDISQFSIKAAQNNGIKQCHEAMAASNLGRPDAAQSKIIIDHLKNAGIELNPEILKYIEDKAEIREQLSTVYEYVKKKEAHEVFERKVQGLMSAASFVTELGRFTKNKDICRMGVVAQTAIQVGTCMMALKGSLTMASLNPILGIGMALFSLAGSGLFGKGEKSANEMLMSAMNALAVELQEFKKEMHERLNRIESQLLDVHLNIIFGFCDMQIQHKNIMGLLDEIQEHLLEDQSDNRERFSTITKSIETLSQMHTHAARTTKLHEIYKDIHEATGQFHIEAADFKKLYHKLEPDLSELQQNHSALVGERNLEPHLFVERFEADESNSFASEFNIKSLSDALLSEAKSVVNPSVWSWQLIGFMELVKRYYEQSNMPKRRISKAEVDSLVKIRLVGEETYQFMQDLRDEKVIQTLHKNYINAGKALSDELIHYIDKSQTKVSKALDKKYAQTIEIIGNKAYGSKTTTFDIFLAQEITHNIQPVSGWFTGEVSNEHWKWGRKYENRGLHPVSHLTKELAKCINEYKEELGRSITTTKNSYIAQVKTKLGDYTNAYHFFDNPIVGNHYHYAFVFPKNSKDPILPLPASYQAPIPDDIRQAEWLGLGQIEFRYDIVEVKNSATPTEPKYDFVLETHFISETQSILLSTLKTEYNPGVYKLQTCREEGIWWFWVGGNCCRDGVTTYPEIYTNHTHEDNTWRNWAYIPTLKNFAGKRSEITQVSEHKAIYDSKPIAAQIQAKQTGYRKMLADNLRNDIMSNKESALGKALIQYSDAFYKLKSTLVLAYGENNLRKIPEFNILFGKELTHRIRIIEFLKSISQTGENLNFANVLNNSIEKIRSQLPEGLKAIKKMHLKESHLEFVLSIFDEMLVWYQLTAVQENQLCSSIDVQQRQEAQIKIFQGVFELLTKTFAACGKSSQEEIASVMAQLGEKNPENFAEILALMQQNQSGKLLLSSMPVDAIKPKLAGRELADQKQISPATGTLPTAKSSATASSVSLFSSSAAVEVPRGKVVSRSLILE